MRSTHRTSIHRTSPAQASNLDSIQDIDHAPRPSRLGALTLASLGGACIVFASALLLRAPQKADVAAHDPLGDLVAKTGSGGPKKGGDDLSVTFPRMLSDGDKPTTALEGIRDGKCTSSPAGLDLPPGTPTTPHPAMDRLPVFPLPEQDVLAAGGNEASAPKDALTTMASKTSSSSLAS